MSRARRSASALAILLVVSAAGSAAAARGSGERLRRLHFPPAPARVERVVPAVPVPAEPAPPPPAGGETVPAPPGPPSPAPPAPLPRTVAVDETEYSIGLSRPLVGAGSVTFNVYNRGMDDHDLAVVDATGAVQAVAVPPRESRALVVQLAPGRTRVYCSLFAGTVESHEARGMVTSIDVG